MRAGSLIILTLQATSSAFASNPEDALKQLQSLNDAAFKQAQQDASSNAAARTAESCTLSNLKVRREWYVPHVVLFTGLTANHLLQGNSKRPGEEELHQRRQMSDVQTGQDSILACTWRQEPLR